MADINFFHNRGPFSLEKLAEFSGCKLSTEENKDMLIEDVAPLDLANNTHLTFLNNTKYLPSLKDSKAKACIISEKYKDYADSNTILLFSESPYVAYAKIATLFYASDDVKEFLAPSATIAPSAKVGKNCSIGPNVIIGENVVIGDNNIIEGNVVINSGVRIGDNCHIMANSTLTHCIIGNYVIIKSGARIGQDGFGFATDKGVHLKVPQLGRAIIGNHVNIGSNCCIDRGSGPDTIIGDGCKIDNLVQIGHNVQLGRGCIIVAQVGIAGSTKLGNYVVLGGQVGVAGHLNIGDMVNIAAQSGVIHNLEPKKVYGGSPAIAVKDWHRQTIAVANLIKKNRLKKTKEE